MANEARIDALPWSADALDRIRELATARDYLDLLIEQAVRECRTNAQRLAGIEQDTLNDSNRERVSYEPFSWGRIADQLGVTRQSAHRKYAHLI